MPEPSWIFSDVPWVPKQSRNWFTSEVGVGASPTMASRVPCPRRPAACSGASPYAFRIWLGNSPSEDASAEG